MRAERLPDRPRLCELLPDALRVSRRALAVAVIRPWPPLVVFLVAGTLGWWPLAVSAIAFLFAADVVVLHDLFHRNLGLPRWVNEVFLTVYGLLLLNSGHALAASHRHHHRIYPGPDDPEAYVDGWPIWRVIVEGPRYRFKVWVWALRNCRGDRVVMSAEMVVCALVWIAALTVGARAPQLLGYVIIAELGSWTFPLISVTGVHDRKAEGSLRQTRTMRSPLLGRLLLGMQYHLEHHLFPRVPACRLPELAEAIEPWLRQNDAAISRPGTRA